MGFIFNEKVVNLRAWQYYLENAIFTFIITTIILLLIKLLNPNQDLGIYEHFTQSVIELLRKETRGVLHDIYSIEKKYIEGNLIKSYVDEIRILGKSNIKLLSNSCHQSINIDEYITIINKYNNNYLENVKQLSKHQIQDCKQQCQFVIKLVKDFYDRYKKILRNNLSSKTLSKQEYLLEKNKNHYIFKLIEATNNQMDEIYDLSDKQTEIGTSVYKKIKHDSNLLKNINNHDLEFYITNIKNKIGDSIISIITIGKQLLKNNEKYAKIYLELVSELGNRQLHILSDVNILKCHSEEITQSETNFKDYLLETSYSLNQNVISSENNLEEYGIDSELSLDELHLEEECLSKSNQKIQPEQPDVSQPRDTISDPRYYIDRHHIVSDNDPCKPTTSEVHPEETHPEETHPEETHPEETKREETQPESGFKTRDENGQLIQCIPMNNDGNMDLDGNMDGNNLGLDKTPGEEILSQEEGDDLPPTLLLDGLTCQNEKFSKLGVYRIIKNKKINGHGVWKKEGGKGGKSGKGGKGDEVYLYYNKHNHWIFGKREDMERGSGSGWIFANSKEKSPNLVKSGWYVYIENHDLRRLGNEIPCEENWLRCGWRLEPNLKLHSINFNS